MEMSIEEARKVLSEFGYEFSSKNNLSQLGGLKVLLELLKRGKYRECWEELFGSYKARTLIQFVIGLWSGARTMVEAGQTGKDPLIRKFIGNAVEEAQLGRDFRGFSKAEIEALHDFNTAQTVFEINTTSELVV